MAAVCGGCRAEVPDGALIRLNGVDYVYADMMFTRATGLPTSRVCADCAELITDTRSRAHVKDLRP